MEGLPFQAQGLCSDEDGAAARGDPLLQGGPSLRASIWRRRPGHQDGLPPQQRFIGELPDLHASAGQPPTQRRIPAAEGDGASDPWQRGWIVHTEHRLAARRSAALEQGCEEAVAPLGPLRWHRPSVEGEGEGSLAFWDLHGDSLVEDACAVGSHYLETHWVAAWGQGILVRQYGLQLDGSSPVHVSRFGKEAQPQRGEAIGHSVRGAWLQLAEQGEEPLSAVHMVHHACNAVAHQVGVGA